MRVSRPAAISLNVLNILAPVLLGLAVVLIVAAKIGENTAAIHRLLIQWAACLVAAALAARIVWAVCIRIVRKKIDARGE